MKSFLRSLIQALAIAMILALLVRTVVRVYQIPSDSMEPTLFAGDHIVATRYWTDEPARGDIVVFHSPEPPHERLIKRIVGVPGDLVDTHNGRVRIGGHVIAEPYARDAGKSDPIAPLIVPPGTFYVLGDNRSVSLDSRQWGPLPRDLIIGRARVVLWSSGNSRGGRIFKWID